MESDLTAQYVYSDAETLTESIFFLFKYEGLDETALKWNGGQ